jgi:hypothetical protein
MSDIVVLATSLTELRQAGADFVFTDRHAIYAGARFSAEWDDLAWIPWETIASSDFSRDPDDPEKMDRYQAEALVHHHVPVTHIPAIACSCDGTKDIVERYVASAGAGPRVLCRPDYFFR